MPSSKDDSPAPDPIPSPLTGRLYSPSPGSEAIQWLELGFAVHPLVPGSKAWYEGDGKSERLFTLPERIDHVTHNPPRWSRIGVEPASLRGRHNFIVVDDDSHKEKYTNADRGLCAQALAILMPSRQFVPQESTPSGGRHYYLRNPENIDIRNKPTVGIDFIGAHNVACWPTEGYEFLVPFPPDIESSPAITVEAFEAAIRLLKPPSNTARDSHAIRAKGRNNHARDLLWNACMSALRTYSDETAAKHFAFVLYEEKIQEMRAILEGESPGDWHVSPKADFERTWPNALAAKQDQDNLGIIFEDGYLRAWGRPDGKKSPLVPLDFIQGQIRSIWRCQVYAGPPSGLPIQGTKVEMVDGTTAFLARTDTSPNAVNHALNGIQFRNVPHSTYAEQGWYSHQAVAMGLAMCASGESWALPTGIWWRHEFDPLIRPRLPDAPWAFYAGGGVISPKTGLLDEGIPVAPVTAEQVFHSTNLGDSVPWKLGPPGDPAEVAAFCRTAAGFQVTHIAAQACALAALGLLRGWLRGSSVVGKSQPFVSVEGPPGSGKTTGIFAAMYGLAGAKSSLRSEAFYSVEMTQSRCATLVMDDQDLGGEWATPLRLQQSEQAWSKTNSIRELLGLTVVSSQGFAILEKDQALQDRAFRISVPDIVKDRRSLLDPARLQSTDLWQISRHAADQHQGEFTRLVVRACGMAPIEEAVGSVQSYWASREDLSVRLRLIYITVELSLRVYCWIARGADPAESWWTADLPFQLDDGSEVDLVSELRTPPDDSVFVAISDLRRESAPLATAVRGYFREVMRLDLDVHGKPDNAAWYRDKAMWITKDRLSIRSVELRRWAERQRWPEGVRKLLFTTAQFESELDGLGASKTMSDKGVRYRRLSVEATAAFLGEVIGWTRAPIDDDVEDRQVELELTDASVSKE